MRKRLLHLIFVLLSIVAVQAQELKVCTYNLRYKNSNDTDAGNGWNTRRTYLINFVNFQQPDLLGVQEAVPAQMTDMRNGLTGYGNIGVGRNDGNNSGEYSAIFYRKDRLVLIDSGNFWLSDTPDKPSKGFPSKGGSTTYYRICTWGKFFDKLTGTVIYHFNTHMDLDAVNRQQSYYLIKQRVQEYASTTAPVLITGDYNAVQTEEAYKLFYNSGFLYDCYEKTKQKFITNGTCPGFNAGNYSTVSGELRRIDHIFVTRAFNIDHYGVLNPCYYSTSGTATYYERNYSDHSPVLAKLTLKSPENITQPELVDGVYQISNASELQGFSYIVNGIAGFKKNAAANAVLLDDIDMKSLSSWQPIGTSDSPFTGTFDGQNHKLSGFSMKSASGDGQGLIGYASNATIKDFCIEGSISYNGGTGVGAVGWATSSTLSGIHSKLTITVPATSHHIGGVCGHLSENSTASGCSFSGTIKVTDADTNDCIGGIGGYSNNGVSYENCANYGSITFAKADAFAGGICGYVNNDSFAGIFNCLNVGTVKMSSGTPTYGGAFVGWLRAHANSEFENSYWLNGSAPNAYGGETQEAATAVTAEQLASGEVCYALNGDQKDIIWFQTIGTDKYPLLDPTHGIVINEEGIYTGIQEMKREELRTKNERTAIFNLAGQRLSKMQKGINIINGKKYIKQ